MGAQRKREVDVEKMGVEQVDQLSQKLGDKVSEILNKTCEECNRLLNIYGLEIEVNYNIKEKKKK